MDKSIPPRKPIQNLDLEEICSFNRLVTEELLLWGLIPSLAAALAILVLVRVAFIARRPFQYLASGIVIGFTSWSLLILYRMFILEAWPTFLPHIAIALSVLITALQFAYRQKTLT